MDVLFKIKYYIPIPQKKLMNVKLIQNVNIYDQQGLKWYQRP